MQTVISFKFTSDLLSGLEFSIFFNEIVKKIYDFFQRLPMKNNFIVNLYENIKQQILRGDEKGRKGWFD